jgi:hypothetical protein
MASYGMADSKGLGGNITSIYGKTKSAYDAMVKNALAKYNQSAALFAPKGELERAENQIIDSNASKALAAGNAESVATGMSSGSMALGLKKRAMTDAALAKAAGMRSRYGMYGQALNQAGGAMMDAGRGEISMYGPYIGATASMYGGGNYSNTSGLGAAADVLANKSSINAQSRATQAILDQQSWQNFANSNPYKTNLANSQGKTWIDLWD